jgi:hypothetical protein
MTLVTVILSDGRRREFETTVDEAEKLHDLGTIPSKRSHLSGERLNKDERESIIVTFGNGAKRRLVIGSEESEELQGRGHAVRSGLYGAFSWLYLVPKSIRIALVTLFVGALLTPAISRQFTDRQLESELKSRVAGQIITSSISAIETPHTLVFHQLSEFRIAAEDCRLFQIDKKQKSREQCESAESKADRAAIQRLLGSQSRWIKDGIIIGNELMTFLNPKLRQEWDAFQDMVFTFSRVTPGACGSGYDQSVKKVQDYLNSISPGWYSEVTKDLGGAGKKPCIERKDQIRNVYSEGDPAFLSTYQAITDRLQERSIEIAGDVRKDHTSRYSVGFRDFLTDIATPFGTD